MTLGTLSQPMRQKSILIFQYFFLLKKALNEETIGGKYIEQYVDDIEREVLIFQSVLETVPLFNSKGLIAYVFLVPKKGGLQTYDGRYQSHRKYSAFFLLQDFCFTTAESLI